MDKSIIPLVVSKLSDIFCKEIEFVRIIEDNLRHDKIFIFKVGDYKYECFVNLKTKQLQDIALAFEDCIDNGISFTDKAVINTNSKITLGMTKQDIVNLLVDEIGIRKEQIWNEYFFKSGHKQDNFIEDAHSCLIIFKENIMKRCLLDIVFDDKTNKISNVIFVCIADLDSVPVFDSKDAHDPGDEN